jgi:hypothetical protein
VITIECEQYDVTVHLFIGTGRSPGKITFMTLTFIYRRPVLLRFKWSFPLLLEPN